MRNPFKQRGFLKSKDHFTYLIAYASFVMSFTDVASDYVTFMAMYASDMCELFNPCLSVSSLPHLKKKIFETRSTQEGLYPESEQIFIFHELIDIVHHIQKFGHVRGLMCFAGERANGQISSCATKGGVNYLKTLYNRYVIKEELMLKHFLIRDENDYNNQNIYSDFALKLRGKEVFVNHFTDLELNVLYKIVFNFLETQAVKPTLLLKVSPFFRLYSAFRYLVDAGGYPSTSTGGFYLWLSACNNPTRDLSDYFVSLVEEDVEDEEKDLLGCCNGTVYLSDLKKVSECVLPQKRFQTFDTIIVKGTRFKCRGAQFAYPGGINNDLSRVYGWKKHYSSIARVRKYTLTKHKTKETETKCDIQFAWLNCAFRLCMPCDRLIHGLALAHCSLRDAVYSEQRWQYQVSVTNGAICHDQFVCLNYIDSSPIASSPFNASDKVLLRQHDLTAFASTSTTNTDCYAVDNDNTLKKLFLIPLKPERLEIVYGNVLQDVDKTLVLEQDCHFRLFLLLLVVFFPLTIYFYFYFYH
jgi:hypothetical protein